MDLLDRLRPRWRHSDPDVRAAAARDLGPEDRDAVETLARDPDVRVRRVAVKKVEDPAVLDAIALDDADPGVRETAAERARARRVTVACGDAPVAECEAAMAALTDERSLASIAGGARHEAVRAAALERLNGDRPLREVVRSAADPAIRLAALARIQDAAILRAIAMGEGPAEVTVAAVERIGDPDALRAIAEHRTASKAARQRARALLPAGADLHAVGHKEARARQQALCSLVEGLTAERDVMRAADRVREAEHEWQAIARDVPPRDDVAARFARAVAAIADDAGSLTRRQAAADHARMALEEGLAARRALCERVEALDGAGARHALDDARAEWHRLAPLADERVPDLARRFAEAGAACLDRYESWRGGATLVSGLEAVVVEAEGLAGTSPVPPAKAWQALERRWRGLPRPPEAADAVAKLDTRWTVAGERLERRRREEQARRGEAAQENLTRLQALHARVDEMVTAEGPLKPNTARRDLQALDAAVQDLGPLPPDERRAAWTERLSDARDRLLRRVRQEEETEDWRRWANVVAQEELIRRVEALLEANDLAEGTRQLGKLQTDWAAVATATPDKSQALWERFRSVRNELRKRCDVYMSENLEKKRALCAQVADVGDATSWNETTDLIKRAQAEWKAIGPVPGKHAQSLWQQFREPCDRFFSRRKEHFEKVDAERKEHAGKKIALCERAEGLADSTDWDATTALMKQLQAEWKASGPLPRAQGEALWQRFRGACDRFFDRRNRREEIAREATLDRGRALCDVVEALAATLEGGEEPAGDGGGEPGKTVDETWGEWLRLDLGTSGDARAIDDRLRAACARVGVARPECLRGTRFDPDTTRKRREKLCAKLEEMAGASKEAPKAQSLQEMALALRDRLASNTIAGGSGSAKGRREDVAREVEKIAATWAHLGPAFDDAGRELEARYERARAAVAERAR